MLITSRGALRQPIQSTEPINLVDTRRQSGEMAHHMVQSPEIVPTSGSRVTVTISRNMTTRGMRRAVLEAMEGAPHDLVLDLRALAVMQDTGLALLVGVNARHRSRGRLLTLVCAKGSATEQALARAGLTRVFTVVPALGLLPPA